MYSVNIPLYYIFEIHTYKKYYWQALIIRQLLQTYGNDRFVPDAEKLYALLLLQKCII